MSFINGLLINSIKRELHPIYALGSNNLIDPKYKNLEFFQNGQILDENCSQRTEVKEYTSRAEEAWQPNQSSSEDEVGYWENISLTKVHRVCFCQQFFCTVSRLIIFFLCSIFPLENRAYSFSRSFFLYQFSVQC